MSVASINLIIYSIDVFKRLPWNQLFDVDETFVQVEFINLKCSGGLN